jgi:hypothetical protein
VADKTRNGGEAKAVNSSQNAAREWLRQRFSGSDGIRTGLQLFVLTHFLHANRYLLRSKML